MESKLNKESTSYKIESTIDDKRETLIIKTDISRNKLKKYKISKSRQYIVEEYDDMCEEISKIEKLIPLKYDKMRLAILVILNILSVFIINLFIVWFPSLKLLFIYSICSIEEAEFIAVYGRGIIF